MNEVGCIRQKCAKRRFHRLRRRCTKDQVGTEDFVGIREIVDSQQDSGTMIGSATYSVSSAHERLIYRSYKMANPSFSSSAFGRIGAAALLGASTPRPMYAKVLPTVQPSATSSCTVT